MQDRFGSSRRPTPTHRLPIELRRRRRPRRPVAAISHVMRRGRCPHRPAWGCRGGRLCPPSARVHGVCRAACPHAAGVVLRIAVGGVQPPRPAVGFIGQGPCALPGHAVMNWAPAQKRTEFSPFLLLPHPSCLGDPDGEQDLILRVLAAAGGVDPRRAHEGQGAVQAVEKQPHILEDERGPPVGRRDLDLP